MKWLFRLVVAPYLVILITVGILVAVNRGPSSPSPVHGVQTDVVAADWAMTQQMTTSVGPGMDEQMQGYGMLQRSQDPAYLTALEAYAHQIDRMLGRSP